MLYSFGLPSVSVDIQNVLRTLSNMLKVLCMGFTGSIYIKKMSIIMQLKKRSYLYAQMKSTFCHIYVFSECHIKVSNPSSASLFCNQCTYDT